VLLLTGAFEPVDRQKAVEVGCDGVLVKPFEPQVVIGRVKELLARPRGAATTSMAVTAPSAPQASWTFPEVPAPTTKAGDAPASSASAGEFFDQLDAALAALPGTRADAPDPVDHFRSEEGAALPAAPEPALAPLPLPALQSATTLPPTQAMPSLAEAFTVLLAAEQPGGASVDLTAWAPPVPAPVVSDDLVDRVAERVLGRLSAQVLRETIAELVSTTAERLIREEIERIKAAIK
jgi:CheY-like chemotaxis protein